MKKILLLLMMSVGLGSCTTENEEDFVQYGYDTSQKSNAQAEAALLAVPACFTDLAATVHVDVSNGIGNPVVVFTPVITGTPATSKFKAKVEVQPLADCDDMNSDTGSVLVFALSGTVQDVVANPPSISVLPSSMPLCYKWRFVLEGVASVNRAPICYSASPWYESPLF